MTGIPLRRAPTVVHRSRLPIDPRFQARLVAVRRDQAQRRFRHVMWLALATLVLAGLWGLSRSPLLAVQRVGVDGAVHTGRAAVVSAAGLDRHRQMTDVSPSELRGRLRSLPWVGNVSVRRQWPSTVRLAIVERSPVAQTPAANGQRAIVDISGRVLAVGPEASSVLADRRPALPVLGGISAPVSAGQVLGARANAVLTLALDLPRALSEPSPGGGVGERGALTVTAVAVAPDGALSASLAPGVVVIFGAPDQLPAKLSALRTVLAHLGPATQVTVDLRAPDSPVLTEGNSRSIVSTIQRG